MKEDASPLDLEEVQSRFSPLVAEAKFQEASLLLDRAGQGRLESAERNEIRALRNTLRRAAFLHENPIHLGVFSSSQFFELGSTVPLFFEIMNLADHELCIPSSGSLSWLPWCEKRRSCIVCSFRIVDISALDGSLCSGKWDQVEALEETWRLAPGKSRAARVEINMPVSEGVVYRRLEISAYLIPGGLQSGDLDYGMIRLDFSPRIVHLIPAEAYQALSHTRVFLEEPQEGDTARNLILTALMSEGKARWKALDLLIGSLPDYPDLERRIVLSGLRVVTGLSLGYDTNRWLDWWALNRDAGYEELQSAATEPLSFSPPPGHINQGLILACASIGLLSAQVADANKPSPGASDRLDPDDKARLRASLSDPYYCRRYAARKRLSALGDDAFAFMVELLSDPSPHVRAAAAYALGQLGTEPARERLQARLSTEDDQWVLQQIVQALAFDGPLASTSPTLADLERNTILTNLYRDRVLMALFEKILHFGGLPGFYDEQFSAIWTVGDDVDEDLIKIARDSDYAYLVRVLAIMALHENPSSKLLQALQPLILDPKRECDVEFDEFLNFDIDEDFILSNHRRNLSKYARFSLAKAGITRFNLDKIAVMKSWLQQNKDRVFKEKPSRNLGLGLDFDPYRDFGKRLILDIGYNYQQFDQFGDAERWYTLLIDQFQEDKKSSLIAEAQYNLGCLYAVTNRTEEALTALRHAIDNGFLDLSWMERDKDLDSVRNLPEFQRLKDRIINRSPDSEEE